MVTDIIGPEQIAKVVSRRTSIPVTRLDQNEKVRLMDFANRLHQRVVGQDQIVKAVTETVLRSRLGLGRPQQPIGSFLFLGATGVGKTELAKALAEQLFDDINLLIRFDMSEFMGQHSSQVVMEIAATVLATVGMVVDGGFSDMRRESRKLFDLGPTAYWWTLVSNVVTWQLCFMGTAGMVFLTTSVTGGICMTALMAINVVAGVVVYGDELGGVKVVSTVICGWGFCSYVYGMHVKMNSDRKKVKVIVNDNDNDNDGRDHQLVITSGV